MLNTLIAKLLPIIPRRLVKAVANRYIAGETIDDMIATVQHLNRAGASATVDLLGEFVTARDHAERETASILKVLDAIHQYHLHSGISVKLTSLGLDIDKEFCYRNLVSIVTRARTYGIFVRIDMENSPYTSVTLALYERLRADSFDNVGVVLQAYMRRSMEDVQALAPLAASVRLCKGIYNESADIAFKSREEVRANFRDLLSLLFENGMYVGIATHDTVLLDYAKNLIANSGYPSDRYEFQMLLGVREDLLRAMIDEGLKVRIYVPFGSDWYGYSVRRLRENPQIAGHVFKAMFRR